MAGPRYIGECSPATTHPISPAARIHPQARTIRDDEFMIPTADFRALVESAFRWLLDRGFEATSTSYGNVGSTTLLTDNRRWLRLAWEPGEGAIHLSWGDVLPPGQFNADPLRSPRPLQDLVPGHAIRDLEIAGAVAGDDPSTLVVPLQRLSQIVRDSGGTRLAAD